MSVEPSDRLAYWKRHFDDQKRIKLEKQLTEKKYIENPLYATHFRSKVPEENRLVRKSITPSERMIIGLKKELNTYKNLLRNQQDNYDSLLLGNIKYTKLSGYFNINSEMVVKNFNQQIGLSTHLIDTKSLKTNWDPMYKNYLIK